MQRTSPRFRRRPPDRPGKENEMNPDLAVRDGRWKLLCRIDGSVTQLYDLNRDVEESNDGRRTVPMWWHAVLAWNATLPEDGVTLTAQQARCFLVLDCSV